MFIFYIFFVFSIKLILPFFYTGVPPNVSDERIEALTELRDTLAKSDPSALFNVVNELSVVCFIIYLLPSAKWFLSTGCKKNPLTYPALTY